MIHFCLKQEGHELRGDCDKTIIIDTRNHLFLECVTMLADRASFLRDLLWHVCRCSCRIGLARNSHLSEFNKLEVDISGKTAFSKEFVSNIFEDNPLFYSNCIVQYLM